MRLIDADAVTVSMTDSYYLEIVKAWLDKTPTVDPVKHEKWIRTQLTDIYTGKKKSCVICSGCGHRQTASSAFCGGCGARMDGDVIDRSDT